MLKCTLFLLLTIATLNILHAGTQKKTAAPKLSQLGIALTASPSSTTQTVSNLMFAVGSTGTVIIKNTSTLGANNIAAIIPAGSHITVRTNTCPARLEPAATCQLVFTSLISEGPRAITIKGSNSTIVTVNVTVSPVAISVSPATLTLETGSGTAGTLTITNNSSYVAARNVRAVLPADWSDVFQDASGCTVIAPLGGTCQLQFTPADRSHAAATVTISGNNTTQATAVISVSSSAHANLNVSSSTLALATQGILTDASGAAFAAPGLVSKARTLTIINDGPATANNVTYTLNPALPTGTTITPASCGKMGRDTSCLLTITPGPTPSNPANQNATGSVISVHGTNTSTATSNIIVLTYGNRYQAGFVFAINDNTPTTGSVGGVVAALADQSSGIVWSSDNMGAPTANDIPEVNDNAVSPPCAGNTDGACNTTVIVNYYSLINPAFYAAGICQQTQAVGTYGNWYLPADCQMGYGFASCGTQPSPTAQNMRSNLVDNGSIGNFTGSYWSSSQAQLTEGGQALVQNLQIGGSLGRSVKSTVFKVRCVRAIT